MKISDLTFACKSDNWRSVENITLLMHVKVIIGGQQSITLEIFRFHTLACKSDNWRSVENNTFENFK